MRRSRALPTNPAAVLASPPVLTFVTRPATVAVTPVGTWERGGGAGGGGGGGGGGGVGGGGWAAVSGDTAATSVVVPRTPSYNRVISGGKVSVSGRWSGARATSRRNTAIAESGRPR